MWPMTSALSSAKGEARSLGLGAVAEQLDRLEPPGGRRGAGAVRVRGRERRDAPHQFARHAEPLAACGEDAQTHGTAEELVHQLRRGSDEMLAVVQDHQGRALGEVLGERVRQRSTRDLADTDRRRHGRRDE